jgi:hypothetical protein
MIHSSTFCEISLTKNVFIEVSVRKRTRRGKTSDLCQNFPENMRNFSKKFDVFPVFGGGKPLPPRSSGNLSQCNQTLHGFLFYPGQGRELCLDPKF